MAREESREVVQDNHTLYKCWLKNVTPKGTRRIPMSHYSYEFNGSDQPGKYIRKTYNSPIEGNLCISTVESVDSLISEVLRPTSLRDLRFSGDWGPAGHEDYSWTGSSIEKAIAGKIANRKDSQLNLGLFFAQADKSLQTVTTAATRIYAMTKALKRGRLGDAYRALGIQHPREGVRLKPGERRYPPPKRVRDNASSYFLEMQYGWQPILNDAYGAAQKIASLANEEKEFFRVRHRGGSEVVRNYDLVPHPLRPLKLLDIDSLKFEATVKFRADDKWIAMASSLGLTNPMLIAWDVVPFSFVIDWFIPVGNYLESISAFHGLEFLEGCISHIRKRQCDYFRKGKPLTVISYGHYYPEGGVPGGELYDEVTEEVTQARYSAVSYGFVRTAIDQFPAPTLSDYGPKGFTWTRAAVTAALLQTYASKAKSK